MELTTEQIQRAEQSTIAYLQENPPSTPLRAIGSLIRSLYAEIQRSAEPQYDEDDLFYQTLITFIRECEICPSFPYTKEEMIEAMAKELKANEKEEPVTQSA